MIIVAIFVFCGTFFGSALIAQPEAGLRVLVDLGTQSQDSLPVLVHLGDNLGVLEELDGKIDFMAVPAEEYIELDYRKSLREQGKLPGR